MTEAGGAGADPTAPPPPALRGIFFAEFDNVLGPKVSFQAPEGCARARLWVWPVLQVYLVFGICAARHVQLRTRTRRGRLLPEAAFETVSEYIVTKPQLCGKLSVLQVAPVGGYGGGTLLAYPVGIESSQYARNALLFAVGFECAPGAPAAALAALEPVLRKLVNAVRTLEVESGFLSAPGARAALAGILPAVLAGLRTAGGAVVRVDAANAVALKLFDAPGPGRAPPPPPVAPHMVPVPAGVDSLGDERASAALRGAASRSWDLVLRALVARVDGAASVAAVAVAAGVPLLAACAGVRQLLAAGLVHVVDSFHEENVYAVGAGFEGAAACGDTLAALAAAATIGGDGGAGPVTAATALRAVAAFGAGVRVRLALGPPSARGLDARRLVRCALVRGLLRRVYEFPAPRRRAGGREEAGGGLAGFDGSRGLEAGGADVGATRAALAKAARFVVVRHTVDEEPA